MLFFSTFVSENFHNERGKKRQPWKAWVFSMREVIPLHPPTIIPGLKVLASLKGRE